MKIAFILDDFPSTTQTFIISQINGVIEAGNKVDIFALRYNQLAKVHYELSKNNLPDRVTYLPRFPTGSRFQRVLKSIKSIFVHAAWRHPLMLVKTLNVTKYRPMLALFFRAIPFFKTGRRSYDIIHCQFGTVAPLTLQLKQIGALDGCLVTSIRGHDITQEKQLSRNVYSDLYQYGDLFLPVSDSLRQMLISDGCDPSKIVIHHSGIDCRKFDFLPRSLAPGEVVKLITTARLVEMKGLKYAVEAVSILLKKGVDVSYEIIGDGPLRNEIENQVRALGLQEKIILSGWLEHDEVKKRLLNAHILMAPSITADNGEKEGIPNAVKEAMAQGMPVVATRHSGIPELVEHGISGLLSDEKNVQELANNIEYLVRNESEWLKLGENARKKVLDEFDSTKKNSELIEIYRSLVNSRAN